MISFKNSSENTMVQVTNLDKAYKLYNRPSMRFLDLLTPDCFQLHQKFYALKKISFLLEPGQSLGLIGPNGSGKSTLLRVLAGITRPTRGNIIVKGESTSLLDLGVGYIQEFSGRENLCLNCSLLGIEGRRAKEAVARMIEFAEIGDFINRPLRTYSSGMFLRLAFSFMSEINPDILFIDEILSVGDIYFRNKSLRRILELREQGKILIIASHESEMIRQLCDQVLWLDHGNVVFFGDVREGVRAYEKDAKKYIEKNLMQLKNRQPTNGKDKGEVDFVFRVAGKICGTGEMRIVKVILRDNHGNEHWKVETGKPVDVELIVYAVKKTSRATFGFFIYDSSGQMIAVCHSSEEVDSWDEPFCGLGSVVLKLPPLLLVEGTYFIGVGITTVGYDGTVQTIADYQEQMYEMRVIGYHRHRVGFFRLSGKWLQRKLEGNKGSDFLPTSINMQNEADRRFLYGHWHEREISDAGAFSWMGESASILLKNNGEWLKIVLRTDAQQLKNNPFTLRVMSGEWQEQITVNHQKWEEKWLKIVDSEYHDVLKINFTAGRTWSPKCENMGSDVRELSFAFKEISSHYEKC